MPWLILSLLVLVPSPAAGTVAVTHPYPGITYIARTETVPRTEVMHIVQVDMTAPGIGFKLTGPGGTRETVRQTTLDYLNQEHAQVAINAHFFVPFPTTDTTVNVVGLAASNGNIYSAFEPQPVAAGFTDQSYAIVPFGPALNIDTSNNAGIVHRDTGYPDNKHVLEPVSLYNALSGSAQIVTNGVVTIPVYKDAGHPDGLLTPNGTYSNSNSWYSLLRARTAIGLTQDNKTLVLFTVDAAGGSLGMTGGEVADLLKSDYGVYNALNLDGGGSTTLAMRDPNTGLGSIMNVSADNPLGRAVGSNLAVFAAPEPATMGLLIGGATLLLARKRKIRSHSSCSRKEKTMRSIPPLAAVLCIGLMFLAASSAQASIVSTPYIQDFSGGAGDFTTAYSGGSSTATWSASGGVYTSTITRVSGASFYTWSSVNVSDLGPATPNSSFIISTLLTNMSIGDTSVNVTAGLRFLADTTNTNANAYVVDLNIGANPGKVRLVRWTGSAAKVYPDSAQANQLPVKNFSLPDPYQLDVFGAYDSAGLLDIAVQVTNMNHPTDLAGYGLPLTHITHTGVNGEYGSTPPTGKNFGYYESSSNGPNTTISATMDNFKVLPEPATLGLLALGGAGLALRRRRR
jgi:hypothetical protein